MADVDVHAQQDLEGRDARRKIVEIASGTKMCMFVTDLGGFPGDVRPMELQGADDDGTLWFLSSSDSTKNAHVEKDDRVLLSFQDNDSMRYLSLSGRARIHTDRQTVQRCWSAFANAWFDGKDDPRVTVISVEPVSGHYWESRSGKALAMAKLTLAALTGAKGDDGKVVGDLKP